MNRSALLILLAVLLAGDDAAAGPPNETFFAAIKENDRVKVEALLAREPALAAARRQDGASAIAAAATLHPGKGFLCTDKNPVLRAILARKPVLDVFEAALVGDVRRLAELVGRDPELVAARYPNGWTPLHFAGFGGVLDTVTLLLDKGAAIDARAKNRFHNTPLQTALLCGEREVMVHLLGRGADPNVRQGEGFHPLHEAALLGRVDLIQTLLDHGSDLSPRSDGGETPLGTALRTGQTKAAAYLRARGARK